MFKLSIEDDEGKTTVVPLARDEMTVGRLEGNTIRLTERNVSRKHARLSRQNGALFIEDLSSFNGVRVNGAKIASPTPLREGDEVQIGDYKLVLRGDHPPVTDRPTMPSLPAVTTTTAPLATVGGPVAIPTRASVAAMAAQQPASQMAAQAAVAQPRSRTKTSPPKPMTAVPEVEGAVAEAVEGQPTIPLRALTERPAGSQPAVGPAARLVVLTTDLAGMEIALDKASLVIGRTEENDVLLNHRSISRHHAKIVRDGDHYTIVDLQSANGIRVNGEDYERIELNAGDVVELGHVKIRFVGPLESFVFDPHAPQPRQLPMKAIALGGGALAIIGLAALFLHRSGSSEQPVAEVPTVAPAAVAPPPVAVAPPPPAAPPAPPPPTTPVAILAAAKQAMVAEDWETARSDLGRIAAADDPAIRREATALGRRVESERQGASMFARFDEAANAKNYAAAVSGYQQIPADSVYKRRAQPRYEEARTLLVAEHMTAAEKDRADGRCAEVRQEALEVIRLEPHNQLIRDLSRLCRARPEPVAVSTRSARTRQVAAVAVERSDSSSHHGEPARSEPSRAETTAAAEPEDAEALMKQAREAWLRQQCGAAMDLSRRALRAKPGWTDAYQILAVCSCSLKDAEAAERAYSRLDDKNRTLVHAVCQKNGIAVGD
ncbi:MAG TPA: FHA domain-containing protein [Polyangia bacterium]|nr:FHA domain-containing protein [Polyangia bacterium]